jgi:multidrug transporter EmrE-like cation transporter
MMKSIGYAVLAIAALTSVFFVNALKPTNLIAAMFFSAWLLLPYAALAFVLGFLAKERASEVAYAIVTLLVAASGLLFLADVIFLHPDPQAPNCGSLCAHLPGDRDHRTGADWPLDDRKVERLTGAWPFAGQR